MNNMPAKYDAELEKSILGAMLSETDCLYEGTEKLKENDFFIPAHQVIFKAFQFFKETPQMLDSTSLLVYLTERKMADACGGSGFIGDLAVACGFPSTFPYLVKKLKHYSLARKLQTLGSQIVLNCHERFEEIEQVLSESQNIIMELSENNNPRKITTHSELIEEAITGLEKFYNDGIKPKNGILTGIEKLDKYIGGFRATELYVIAARTSVGKSILAIQLARHGATQEKIGIISLEMSNKELTLRNLASTGIELSHIRDYSLTRDECRELIQNARAMQQLPIFYQDCPSMSPSQFRAICRRLYQQYGVRMIIVDYLQRLRSDDKNKVKKRQEEISEITWSMKTCAMELQIPIIALAQLNRKAEDYDSPELHHLREAGDIEQDADTVIMLYRSKEQTSEQFDNFEHPTVLKIAKQRNGACVEMDLVMEGKFCRFYEEGKRTDSQMPLINPRVSRFENVK